MKKITHSKKTTFFISFSLIICFFNFSAFSQDKKQTVDSKESKVISYSSDIGRVITTAVAKKYIAVFPEYEKKLTLSKDKKTYVDKNDITLIVKLQRANKIEDKNLEQILIAPENQKLVSDLKLNNEPKQTQTLIATPTLETH